jgi:hypothetical protein
MQADHSRKIREMR